MNEGEYSHLPPTSEHTYTCTDKMCEYCYLTKPKYKSKIPDISMLPPEIKNLIITSGGWIRFKAEALLENSRALNRDETFKYKKVINYIDKKAKNKRLKSA